MTAAEAIAQLERQISQHGQSVIVRRYTAPTGDPRPKTDVSTTAFVRPVKAEQLVGSIDQTASNVVLSPTGLSSLLPIKKGDKIVIGGKERNVEFPKPIQIGATLVRIDLVVAG